MPACHGATGADPADVTGYRPLPTDAAARAAGYEYDPARAARAAEFARRFCVHSRGAWRGRPLEFLPWQRREWINPLFGWAHRETGDRRFRQASVYIGKKNGKTEIAAFLALYLALEEPANEIYVIAAGVRQAKIAFSEAAHFARASPALRGRFREREHLRTLTDKKTRSFVEVLSGQKKGKDGYNGSVILDEFAGISPDTASHIWSAVRYAHTSRANGLLTVITTAQADKKHSPAYDEYRRACAVLDGEDVESIELLPVVYSADRVDGRWDDPDTWAACNPSMGVTFGADTLAADCRAAKKNKRAESDFRTLRLNSWDVGAADRWLSATDWDACAGYGGVTEADIIDACRTGEASAVVGCDWGRAYDLSAMVTVVTWGEVTYLVRPRFYLPGELVEQRSRTDGIAYRPLVDAGHVTATPGAVVDAARFRADLVADAADFGTTRVAYDPAGFEDSRQALDDAGLETVRISSGISTIGPACLRMEELVLSGALRHPGHPVLDWCVGNTRAKSTGSDDDWFRPAKSVDGTRSDGGKIDGTMAVVHGLALTLAADDGPGFFVA